MKESTKKNQTFEHDVKAVKFISTILIPGVFIYSIYALIYYPQKSWYNWVLNTLVSCIYIFGFAMMTPQIYINYKLKSVEHLPWKFLAYRATSTFIDDLFAFIIKMPTLRRIACFRDDIIFFIYLYQKWIYKVDYSRPSYYSDKTTYDGTKIQQNNEQETKPNDQAEDKSKEQSKDQSNEDQKESAQGQKDPKEEEKQQEKSLKDKKNE